MYHFDRLPLSRDGTPFEKEFVDACIGIDCDDNTAAAAVEKWLDNDKLSSMYMFLALAEVRCIFEGCAKGDAAIMEVCAAFCKQLGISRRFGANQAKEEYKRWAISAVHKAEGSLYERALEAGAMGEDWCYLEYELSEIVMTEEIRELIKRVISPVPGLLGLYCFVYRANNESDDDGDV